MWSVGCGMWDVGPLAVKTKTCYILGKHTRRKRKEKTHGIRNRNDSSLRRIRKKVPRKIANVLRCTSVALTLLCHRALIQHMARQSIAHHCSTRLQPTHDCAYLRIHPITRGASNGNRTARHWISLLDALFRRWYLVSRHPFDHQNVFRWRIHTTQKLA